MAEGHSAVPATREDAAAAKRGAPTGDCGVDSASSPGLGADAGLPAAAEHRSSKRRREGGGPDRSAAGSTKEFEGACSTGGGPAHVSTAGPDSAAADADGKGGVVVRCERGLRFVQPYYHTFETHAKGRWVGREILEVFAKEFQSEPREAYAAAIMAGLVTVNGSAVRADTVVRDNDLIRNTAHRHEPPVLAQPVRILHEDDGVVAVDKPPSVPVHACGRYRHNTVQGILERDHGRQCLLPCHRLDRLTSGVLIFAKNSAAAKRVQKQIQSHSVQKVYVCRVRGAFPEGTTRCDAPIRVVSHKLGVCSVDAAEGKPSETSFELVHRNRDGTSVVQCTPKTGRMHQIRVHLQHLGFPIANDPVYNLETLADGTAGRPEDWTVDRAIAKVTTTLAARDADTTARASASASSSSPPGGESKEGGGSDGVDWRKTEFYDPACSECQLWRPHPKAESMLIFLHAIKYTGPDWSIRTGLPPWAEKDAPLQ